MSTSRFSVPDILPERNLLMKTVHFYLWRSCVAPYYVKQYLSDRKDLEWEI
jgi:hypothetical protein